MIEPDPVAGVTWVELPEDTVTIYNVAARSMEAILLGLLQWSETLPDSPGRKEVVHHITELSEDWERLTLAMLDHFGGGVE